MTKIRNIINKEYSGVTVIIEVWVIDVCETEVGIMMDDKLSEM